MEHKKLTEKEIIDKLIAIYSQVLKKEIKSEEFVPNISLLEKFHIDSLLALQIIVKVEQEFGIIIEDDEMALKMLDSIESFLEFIEV